MPTEDPTPDPEDHVLPELSQADRSMVRIAFDTLKAEGISYGTVVTVERLQVLLACEHGTSRFGFLIMKLRRFLTRDLGLYFRQEGNGARWAVPTAWEHESIAQTCEERVFRNTLLSVHYRKATLTNEAAQLTAEQRRAMEAGLERSQNRAALIIGRRANAALYA